MRSGVIAKKLGMTRLFLEDGKQVPVTVLQLDSLQVVAQRTSDTDGYTAVQLGAGTAKAKRVSAPMRGHFAKANVAPKRKVAEFRVSPENLIEVGAEISAEPIRASRSEAPFNARASWVSVTTSLASRRRRWTHSANCKSRVLRCVACFLVCCFVCVGSWGEYDVHGFATASVNSTAMELTYYNDHNTALFSVAQEVRSK